MALPVKIVSSFVLCPKPGPEGRAQSGTPRWFLVAIKWTPGSCKPVLTSLQFLKIHGMRIVVWLFNLLFRDGEFYV